MTGYPRKTEVLFNRNPVVVGDFAGLWDQIYSERPALQWCSQPLVWVVGFRLLKGGAQ